MTAHDSLDDCRDDLYWLNALPLGNRCDSTAFPSLPGIWMNDSCKDLKARVGFEVALR